LRWPPTASPALILLIAAVHLRVPRLPVSCLLRPCRELYRKILVSKTHSGAAAALLGQFHVQIEVATLGLLAAGYDERWIQRRLISRNLPFICVQIGIPFTSGIR
jgi:hypothetical protein